MVCSGAVADGVRAYDHVAAASKTGDRHRQQPADLRSRGRLPVLPPVQSNLGARQSSGELRGSGDIWRRFVWLHAALGRRARATLVTTRHYAEIVDRWGGTGIVLHEPPPAWNPSKPTAPGPRPRVLFVTVFDRDEPLEEIMEAAGRLSDGDVVVTGDTSRARAIIDHIPSNVTLSGWLDYERFLRELDAADVVVCLTTSPHAVLRSASEAIYACRVTVMSDQPALRDAFAPAVFCANEPAAIEAGVREAIRDHDRWRQQADTARTKLVERWEEQLSALQHRIG